MTTRNRMRPTQLQHLLLQAALSPDKSIAESARAQWLDRVDIDKLDMGSTQMLPLLDLAGVSDDDQKVAGQVKHIVRFSWLRTQTLAAAAAPAVKALGDAGLKPVLSKGGALVFGHGIDQRHRPMMDIDIVIAPEHLEQGAKILVSLGFEPEILTGLRRYPGQMARDTHAIGFHGARGAALDFHWHFLHHARNPLLDASVADAAVPCEIGGVACHATSLEDTFVIAIVHGSRWARGTTLRWAGDTAMLLTGHAGEMDWDAVVRRARHMRSTVQVADALDYLAELTQQQAPAEARRALRRAPAPVAHRLRRARKDDSDGGPGVPGRLGALAEAYEEDISCVVEPGARTGPGDAVRFLARRWGLASARKVPARALWAATGRPTWPLRPFRPRLSAESERLIRGRPHYEFGSTLDFSDAGDGFDRLGPGWWYPEPHGIWTRTHCARILLPLAEHPPHAQMELEVGLTAAIAPKRPKQRARVVFGNQLVADVVLDEREPGRTVRVVVPASQLTRELVGCISILSDPVMTPADSRMGSDLRQIGVGLQSLRLF